MPVSAEYRKAAAHKSAAPPPNASGLSCSRATSYQPLRNSAKRNIGIEIRISDAEADQKTLSNNSSRKRFQAGCSGSRSRSVKYPKRNEHHSGSVHQVA